MPAPKYQQLTDAIRARLLAGGWGDGGGALPPERRLAQEFAVSRITVRAALAALARDGVLIRRQGRGTFLSGQPRQLAALRPALHLLHDRRQGALPANAFLAALIDAFGRLLAGQGAGLMLHQGAAGEELAARLGFPAGLDALRAGGVVTVGLPDDRAGLAALRGAGVPLAVIGDPHADHGFPTVGGDHEGAAVAAVRHLAAHGHRRIGLVDGPFTLWFCRRRRDGFRRALAALGLPEGVELDTVGWEVAAGAGAAARLCQLAERPSAVLSYGDCSTVGLMQALAARAVRVPEDLAVAVMDHHPWIDRVLPLAMGGWSADCDQLAQRALDLLARQRRGEPAGAAVLVAERHRPAPSCGCPPG